MDRPIKGNADGKYNINFIDETNDICGYYSQQREGVEHELLERLIVKLQDMQTEYFQSVTVGMESDYVSQGSVKMCHYQSIEVKELTQSSNKQCSVCLERLKKKEQVKMLPCQHVFHDKCIRPWFSSNTKCPNCRFDLNDYFNNK